MSMHFATFFDIMLHFSKKDAMIPIYPTAAAPPAALKKERCTMKETAQASRHSKTAERLRLCREQARETLDQIGALVGVNKSTVLRWERGSTTKINLPTLQRLAQHFGVDTAWLAGEDVPPRRGEDWLAQNALPLDELIDLPVWGLSQPGLVRQSPPLSGAFWESATVFGSPPYWDGDHFWLRVAGDSMAPLMDDGDLVLVRRQPIVENGRYAVLLLDGEESMIRRVERGDDWIELQSANPYYPSRRFCGPDTARVQILGLVMESKRKFI